MNDLVALVRSRAARTDLPPRRPDGLPLASASSARQFSISKALCLEKCALCGVNTVSPFLAATDASKRPSAALVIPAARGSSKQPPTPTLPLKAQDPPAISPPPLSEPHVQLSDLCAPCFRVAFKAVVRPLLADEVHRVRLAALLKDTAAATTDADAATAEAARRLVPLHEGQRWACPRCTYNGNMGKDAKCGVCNAAAPHVTKCHACGQHLTPSQIGKPCLALQTAAAGKKTTSATRVGCFAMLTCRDGPKKKPSSAPSARDPVGSDSDEGAAQGVHLVWVCGGCTFVNTVEADRCFACRSERGWECERCSAVNRTRRAPDGERTCSVCGHASVDVAASQAQALGLDPAEVIREKEEAEEARLGAKRLDDRLASMGLRRCVQNGDGNCQFRALAHQLFGSPSLHMLVRHMITAHLATRGREDIEVLFASPRDYDRYVKGMTRDGTWGDELTLRAAADCLGCHIHVISSSVQHWHLHFAPKGAAPKYGVEGWSEATAANAAATMGSVALGPALAMDATLMAPVRAAVLALQAEIAGRRGAAAGDDGTVACLETTRDMASLCADWPEDGDDGFPHVFVAYQSPVHYDDVAVLSSSKSGAPQHKALGRHSVDMCRAIGAVIDALTKEERDWIDAAHHTPVDVPKPTAQPSSGDEWLDIVSDDGLREPLPTGPSRDAERAFLTSIALSTHGDDPAANSSLSAGGDVVSSPSNLQLLAKDTAPPPPPVSKKTPIAADPRASVQAVPIRETVASQAPNGAPAPTTSSTAAAPSQGPSTAGAAPRLRMSVR
jgi:hypothetical protein